MGFLPHTIMKLRIFKYYNKRQDRYRYYVQRKLFFVWVNYDLETFEEGGWIKYEHARQYLDKVMKKEKSKKLKKINKVMYESEV
jgi:hypothetical protein